MPKNALPVRTASDPAFGDELHGSDCCDGISPCFSLSVYNETIIAHILFRVNEFLYHYILIHFKKMSKMHKVLTFDAACGTIYCIAGLTARRRKMKKILRAAVSVLTAAVMAVSSVPTAGVETETPYYIRILSIFNKFIKHF